MGEVLYDYVQHSIPSGGAYAADWEVALISVAETPSTSPGAIPIDRVTKAKFMTFADFIAALQDFPIPATAANPFAGQFTTLRNRTFSGDA